MDDLKSGQEEKGSAHLYRVVAEQESGTRARRLLELAREAERAGENLGAEDPRKPVARFRSTPGRTCVPASSPRW